MITIPIESIPRISGAARALWPVRPRPHRVPSPRPSRGEAGWTLLEMLVVCSLASILGATSVSNFSRMAAQMRTGAASAQLVSDLTFAREMSRRTGVPHYVDVDTSTTSVNYRVKREAAPPTVAPSTDPVVRSSLLATRLRGVRFALNGATTDPYGLAVSAATPGRIVFNARGLPTSASAFFIASDDGSTRRSISVTATGRIRAWTANGSTWR